jgi:hypothetical protein
MLPGTAWRPEGSIAVSGDVSGLWRGQAGELADALLLVIERMDACAQQRYAPTSAGAVASLGRA